MVPTVAVVSSAWKERDRDARRDDPVQNTPLGSTTPAAPTEAEQMAAHQTKLDAYIAERAARLGQTVRTRPTGASGGTTPPASEMPTGQPPKAPTPAAASVAAPTPGSGEQPSTLAALEAKREQLMKDPNYFDAKSDPVKHAAVAREMRQTLRAIEVAESEAAGEAFAPRELAAEMKSRFGVERGKLLGGEITRGETYDQHAAEVFGALADAGVESKAVQRLVRNFASMTVSNVGGSLSDAQLDSLYRTHGARLGEDTAKALLQYHKQHIRGDRA